MQVKRKLVPNDFYIFVPFRNLYRTSSIIRHINKELSFFRSGFNRHPAPNRYVERTCRNNRVFHLQPFSCGKLFTIALGLAALPNALAPVLP